MPILHNLRCLLRHVYHILFGLLRDRLCALGQYYWMKYVDCFNVIRALGTHERVIECMLDCETMRWVGRETLGEEVKTLLA